MGSVPQAPGGSAEHSTVNPAAANPSLPNSFGREITPVFRLINLVTGEVHRQVAVRMPIQNVQRMPETRVSMHYTAGGPHADMPKGDARGMVHFVFQLNTGVWPEGRGYSKPDGFALLWDLRDLLDDYLKGDILPGFERSDFELQFTYPDEPTSSEDQAGDGLYVVVPERSGVENSQSARAPATANVTLRIVAIKRLEGPERIQLDIKYRKRSLLGSFLSLLNTLETYSFDQVFAQYQQLAAPVIKAADSVRRLKEFTKGWVNGVVEFAAFNVNVIDSAIEDLVGLVSAVKELDDSIERAVGLIGEIGVSSASVDPAVSRFDPRLRTRTDLEAFLRAVTRLRNTLIANPAVLSTPMSGGGAAVGVRAGAVSVALPIRRQNNRRRLSAQDRINGRPHMGSSGRDLGAISVQVQAGDTMSRFEGQGFTALDIINLNSLVWPFVDGTRRRPSDEPRPAAGKPRVAYLGESILVPRLATATSVTAAGDSPAAAWAQRGPESLDVLLFGVDYWIDPETRAFALNEATGDLKVVEGVQNLLQGLDHLIRLGLGELHYAPDLGSHLKAEAEGAWGTELRIRLMQLAAKRTLSQDPRIRKVSRLSLDTYDGVTELKAILTTADGVPRGPMALAV